MTIEFSRPLNLSQMCLSNHTFSLSASDQECLELCKRFDFYALRDFSGSFSIHKNKLRADGFTIEGTLNAHITPFEKTEPIPLSTTITIYLFDEEKGHLSEDSDVYMDVDYYQNDEIDWGEVMAQYLFITYCLEE